MDDLVQNYFQCRPLEPASSSALGCVATWLYDIFKCISYTLILIAQLV